MATLTKGHTFASGDTVTATKLNDLVDSATIAAIQTADISDNQITTAKIVDANVTDAKLATGAVTGAAGGGKIAASAITSQTELTDPLASADEFLVHDDSASALRRVAWNSLQPAGSVLQTLFETTDATTTITATFANATKPQYNAGNIIITKAITPSSESNKILIQALVSGNTASNTNDPIVALFNTTSGDAIAAATGTVNGGYGGQICLTFLHSPNTTSEITYRLGVGGRTGNFQLNKRFNAADFDLGGLHVSSLLLQEIKG